jgi:hypothetical protein
MALILFIINKYYFKIVVSIFNISHLRNFRLFDSLSKLFNGNKMKCKIILKHKFKKQRIRPFDLFSGYINYYFNCPTYAIKYV